MLFTGAGFSRDAKNIAGGYLPLGESLKQAIWHLCYPEDPFEPATSLQDLFEYARLNAKNRLRELLLRQLSVDASALPAHYAKLFEFPWLRAYTLNIDDLPQALARAGAVRRHIVPLSATRESHERPSTHLERDLEYVHLNGLLEDAPDGVTFSTTQYAARLASQEPLYVRCVSDVLAHPVVFIGTQLDESPLWQHVELRRRGAVAGRELRRKSFIVTPQLDRTRRELLSREFNVHHLAMTTGEFVESVLAQVAATSSDGFAALRRAQQSQSSVDELPLASALAASSPLAESDYLLGQSPIWADLTQSRAVLREIDRDVERAVTSARGNAGPKDVILIGGTAGSGKTTACMRLALGLAAQGVNVGWVDIETDISPRAIISSMRQSTAPEVLVIDDADRYGVEAPAIAATVRTLPKAPLVVLACRSTKIDRIAERLSVLGVRANEMTMPPLADSDIEGILAVLDRENRLGVLKGLGHQERVRAFREHAGRQLLVAMLQATSGRRFEERIVEELNQLPTAAQSIYAIVAVGTAMRSGLTRDEVVSAVEDQSNVALEALDSLVQRHLVVVRPRRSDLAVRHRVIAEVIVTELGRDGRITDVLSRVAFAAAVKVFRGIDRHGFLYRRIRGLMNHDFLQEQLGAAGARQLLASLEGLLNWDHHYWLQRGSLEVETGDVRVAENFLSQAHSIAPDDVLVQTEYGYLKLRLAVGDPSRRAAGENLEQGVELLTDSIRARGATDPHPFQILGGQVLAFCRRADVEPAEASELLKRVIPSVEEGCRLHPRDNDLRTLLVNLRSHRRDVNR